MMEAPDLDATLPGRYRRDKVKKVRKKMMNNLIRAGVVAAVVAAQTGPAWACACCAEPGARFERSSELTDWEFGALEQLRSNGIADVYETACGSECVLGLTQTDNWHGSALEVGREGVTLTLGPVDSDSAAVVLTAGAPTQFDWFASDPAPGSRGITPGGLYSEVTLPLTMTGSGPGWTGGEATFPARLILIGQSTACMEMSRKTHWMLDVETQALSFRVFGGFGPPEGG